MANWDSQGKLEELFVDELDPSNAQSQAAANGNGTASDTWDTDITGSGGPATSAAPPRAAQAAPSVPYAAASPPGSGGEVPVRQQRAAEKAARRGGAEGAGPAGLRYEEQTVDESEFASLAREGAAIWRNLKLVCNPLIKQEEVTAMLQHWDLWGPLIFTLLLASMLSLQSGQPELEFCVVFVVVIAGGLLLTANVLLLGGSVSFFQSVCLLGYCMFPLDLAAIIAVLVRNGIVRVIIIPLALVWAMRASVPFVAGSVGDKRRYLAVYPLALMYTVLGWLTFIS